MPTLSQAATEAERLIGRLPEARQRGLAQALADLCEAHWRELRGPEPSTSLAHALWSVTPPLADLFADMYAAGSPQLEQALGRHIPSWGLALLVKDQIARGHAEGVRVAHEAMMVFESSEGAVHYAQGIATMLRGGLAAPVPHPHVAQTPLWKALVLIATQTGRCDLMAITQVVQLLAAGPSPMGSLDPSLEQLRKGLDDQGMRFLGIEGNQLYYQQHGHEHKPESVNQVAQTLMRIRQAWLARMHAS